MGRAYHRGGVSRCENGPVNQIPALTATHRYHGGPESTAVASMRLPSAARAAATLSFPSESSRRANEAVKSAFSRGDHDALIDWVGLAEDAQMSVPTDEHYLPLLYVAAQRLPGDDVSFFNDVIEGGSISMTGVRIG